MPTYFNYVEREADSYVNWADVGRDMSNTIDDIQRVREEKKALIEKTYREDLKFIQDNPSGEHETMNAWSLGVAQSSAEMMRLQNTLLKQGKLSLPNYLTFRQNITDSVEKIYTVNSQLQEAFKEVNDRTKAGDNQQLERETKVLLEKYGNLQDTEAYINPLNGTIYLGLTEIVEEDGKSVRRLKKGDGTYLSPDQLQAAAIQKFDKFDERPVLKEFAGSLGKVIEEIRIIGGKDIAGQLNSVTDVTYERIQQIIDALPEDKKPDKKTIDAINAKVEAFKQAETKYIEGILKNPYDALSLLTENGIDKDGNPYNIVFNKADQKTDYDVYVDKTDSKFIPTITEKQNQALTDYLRGQLRVMYDQQAEIKIYNEQREEKVQPRSVSAAEIEAGQENRTASAMGTYIRDIYSGNMAKKQETLKILQADGEVIPSQTYYKTGKKGEVFLHVTRKSDGESTDIKITNEDGTPYQDVVTFGRTAASWLYGGEISNKILMENQAQFDAALNVTPNFTPFDSNQKQNELWDRPAEAPEKVDPLKAVQDKLPLSIFGKGEADAATSLQNALSGYGITAVETSWGAGNWVKLSPPKGSKLKPINVQVAWSNDSDRESKQKDVLDFMKLVLDEKNQGQGNVMSKYTKKKK